MTAATSPPLPNARPAVPPAASLRVLAAITVLVLLVHLGLLEGLPRIQFFLHEPAPMDAALPAALITRTIHPEPVAPPPAPPQIAAPPFAPPDPAPQAAVATEPTAPNSSVAAIDERTAKYAEPSAQTPLDPEPPEPPAPIRLGAGIGHTFSVPPSVRLAYLVEGLVTYSYTGNAEILWLQNGKNYDAKLAIRKFGFDLRTWTSKGELTSGGLEPVRFGDKTRSEVAAHFVRDKGKVIFSANTPDAILEPGAQDHLSVFLQLASLMNGEASSWKPGQAITFQAIGGHYAETWTFVLGPLETLQLPNTSMQAVKFTREPTAEYSTKVEVWLAPAKAYLPIHIRLTQGNGDYVNMRWTGDAAL